MMYPELLDYPGTLNSNGMLKPPPYVASVNDVPTLTSVEDDELHDEPPPAYPDSNLHSTCIPVTATVVTTAHPRPIRNQIGRRTANTEAQIPDIYPGFAFCKFTAGKLETAIRLVIMVRLYMRKLQLACYLQ